MSRWTSSANAAAAALPAINGAWLLDLEFDSGHVRCNNSGYEITWDGDLFPGVGAWGGFDGIEESLDFVARGMRFVLGGVDPALISTIMSERYQGRPASLYIAMLNADMTFVDTPELRWAGYMDTMDIEVVERRGGGQEAQITLTCEHRLRNAPPCARWSDGDQQARSAGDKFFNMTHFVAGYIGKWGDQATTYGGKPGGGFGPG